MQPIPVAVKSEMVNTANCYNSGMPKFRLGQTVGENVEALRKALGSVTKELSRDDLAALVSERHPGNRTLNASTIRRWEKGETEPDLASLGILAELAGVPIDQFMCWDRLRNQANGRGEKGA